MNSRRWILFAALAVVVSAGAIWRYYATTVSAASEEKDLITVPQLDFPLVATAPGLIEAKQSVAVGPPRISSDLRRFKLARLTEEGKEVAEGDFLFELDSTDINRQLRDETANYQRVQEEYQKKRSDFDIQMRDLKLQLEQAKSDYEKLENKLGRQLELESAIVIAETKIRRDAAKEKVRLLENKIKYLTESGRLDLQISTSQQRHFKSHMDIYMDAVDSLTVRAPVSGVVIYKRQPWNNEARQVGSNVESRDTLVELPDLSTLRAKVLVDEVDAGKVRVGQDAQVTVDAVQGRVFNGKVVSLSPILRQAAADRPQRVAEAYVDLDATNDMKAVRPGMSTRAQIQIGKYPMAIVIPMASIQEREGRSFVQVWQAQKKEFEWREVRLTSNDGLSAVISAGLQANEKIRSKPKA